MASAATPSPAAAGSDNSFARVFGVIFSPKPTFESIARRPTWLVPLILIIAVSVLVIAVFGQRVGWRNFMIRQNQQSSRAQKQMEQMTPDQREHMLDQQTKIAPIFGYVGVILGTIIGALLVAAVLMVALNLTSGSKIPFVASLGIVSYAWVPAIIAGLLGILIMFIKDPATVDIEHLVASNAGAFVSDDSPKWLVTLLTSFDIFVFWTMILMALGYGATDPKKISFGKALSTIVIVWAIYIAVKVGFTAAFS
jgi:Yip1-like protein